MKYLNTLVILFSICSITMGMADDVCSLLPSNIYFKNQSQTFNAGYYFILKNGRICFKHIDNNQDWQLFGGTGLPKNTFFDESLAEANSITELTKKEIARQYNDLMNPANIIAIASDGGVTNSELVALSDKGYVYKYTYSDNRWHSNFSIFSSRMIKIVDGIRDWTLGTLDDNMYYYSDHRKNNHSFGLGITTIYTLLENGREIRFADTGLPPDFSHFLCGPMRGRVISERIAGSGSLILLQDKFGNLFYQLNDHDISGQMPMYEYIYDEEDATRNQNDKIWADSWALPVCDWQLLPPIYYKDGKRARVSKLITVLQQNGVKGNSALIARVAGINEDNESGFYELKIFSRQRKWEFIKAPILLNENDFIQEYIPGKFELDDNDDYEYSAKLNNNLSLKLLNFNIHCSPAILEVAIENSGKQVIFYINVHTVDGWTFTLQNSPGRDNIAKVMLGTIEIPKETFALSEKHPDIHEVLKKYFLDYNLKSFSFTILARENESLQMYNNESIINGLNIFFKAKDFKRDVSKGDIFDVFLNDKLFIANKDKLKKMSPYTKIGYIVNLIEKNRLLIQAIAEDEQKFIFDTVKSGVGYGISSIMDLFFQLTGIKSFPSFDRVSQRGAKLSVTARTVRKDFEAHTRASFEGLFYSQKVHSTSLSVIRDRICEYSFLLQNSCTELDRYEVNRHCYEYLERLLNNCYGVNRPSILNN